MVADAHRNHGRHQAGNRGPRDDLAVGDVPRIPTAARSAAAGITRVTGAVPPGPQPAARRRIAVRPARPTAARRAAGRRTALAGRTTILTPGDRAAGHDQHLFAGRRRAGIGRPQAENSIAAAADHFVRPASQAANRKPPLPIADRGGDFRADTPHDDGRLGKRNALAGEDLAGQDPPFAQADIQDRRRLRRPGRRRRGGCWHDRLAGVGGQQLQRQDKPGAGDRGCQISNESKPFQPFHGSMPPQKAPAESRVALVRADRKDEFAVYSNCSFGSDSEDAEENSAEAANSTQTSPSRGQTHPIGRSAQAQTSVPAPL